VLVVVIAYIDIYFVCVYIYNIFNNCRPHGNAIVGEEPIKRKTGGGRGERNVFRHRIFHNAIIIFICWRLPGFGISRA
jgi:hypothetical protein